MSQTEAGILIVVVLGLVAIFAFLRYSQRARVKIKGPGNIGLDLDASNDPQAAIRVEDAKSRKGGLSATDETGRGIDGRKIEVEKDINLKVGQPGPKA
ncbi:MAG: hypothetical protein WA738_02825 [Candidatus Angelobacter sp.]